MKETCQRLKIYQNQQLLEQIDSKLTAMKMQ